VAKRKKEIKNDEGKKQEKKMDGLERRSEKYGHG